MMYTMKKPPKVCFCSWLITFISLATLVSFIGSTLCLFF
jgi:hypothetical protein